MTDCAEIEREVSSVGIFFGAAVSRATLRAALTEALATPPPADPAAAADAQVAEVGGGDSPLNTSRLAIAIGLVALLIAVGVLTDIGGHPDSSKAVFGFAATLFGVIVGLLGGEKPSS